MANVTGIDLNPILQRLNSTNNYHPFDAETFSDWATEAGDIVTISRNGETYVSPVHTSRMVWKGKAPTMQISTTGNEKRDAVSRVSRKKYGRGSAGVRSQEGIHRNFVSEDGILHSELHITESYLRTEFHDETNSLRSEFDMTASHMRTEFLDQVHSLRSEFEVTASHLRTEFEDDVNSLRGEFEVTASHLRTEFTDEVHSLRGEFEVTVSHLRTEFTDEVHSLRSEFEVTASHLRTEFEDDVNSVRSYMHQTASSWEARVEGVTDANGNITAASITVAINAEGSQARINADRIYLLGQTIANTIDANYIATKIESISSLLAQNITAGDIDASSVKVRPVAGMGAISVATAYNGSSLTQNGNTYTLRLAKMNGEYDEYSFSRATTLSGTWSGRNFTVTASPQGNIKAGTVYETIVPDTSDSVAYNANTKQLSRLYYVYSEDENGDADSVILHKTVSIPGDLAYAAGFTDGSASGGSTSLTATWAGGKITVTASPQGATLERLLQAGAVTWSGTRATIPISSVYGSSGQYSDGVVFTPFVDVSSKLQTKTITSNGTVNPDSGYIGFGSVTVSVPVTNAGARFGAASGSYFVEAYDKTSGTSIADSSTGYKLGLSGTKVQIQNSSSTKISNTPEYTIPLETKTISSNGTVNPSSGKVGFSSVTVAVPSDLPNARTRFGASSGSYYVEAYDGSSSGGTSIAGSSTTYKLGFSGKTVQIQNASGSQLSSTPTLTLGISNGTLSSGSRTLTVTAGGSNTTATTTITDYKDGWAAYYSALKWPEVPSTLSATFSVKRPSSTVGSASDKEIRNYVISSKNNNTVYLRYNNQTYAEFLHNKYDSGWGDARGKCSVPSSTSTSGTMTVTIPPATVGGNAVSYSYAPTVDKKYAYIKQGTTTVARISHSIHNDAGNTAFVAYVTGASVPSGTTPTELSYDTNYKFYARYTNADNSAADATGNSYSVRYFKTKADRYNTGYDDNKTAWLYEVNTGSNGGNLNPGIWVTAGSRDHSNNVRYCGTKWYTLKAGGVRQISGEPAGVQTLTANTVYEVYYNNGSGGTPGAGVYFKTPASGGSHSISVSKRWTFGGSGYDTGGKLNGGAFSKSGLSVRTYYYITVSCGGTSKQIYFVCND